MDMIIIFTWMSVIIKKFSELGHILKRFQYFQHPIWFQTGAKISIFPMCFVMSVFVHNLRRPSLSFTVSQMPLGRQCVDHYRMLHRYNVFSHDEMVCNMAMKAETLDVVLASAVHKDMVAMIQDEDNLRETVKKLVGFHCIFISFVL